MLPTNAAYNEAINAGDRNYTIHIMMDKDGQYVASLDNDDIVSFTFKDACTSKGRFALGGTYAKNVAFTFINYDGEYDDTDLYEGVIYIYLCHMSCDFIKGHFIVTKWEHDGNYINVEAADYMIVLNEPYKNIWNLYHSSTPWSDLDQYDWTMTIADFVNDIVSFFGLTLATPAFDGNDETFIMDTEHAKAFRDSNPTCRDVLGYCAELAGGFARFKTEYENGNIVSKLYIMSFPDIAQFTESMVHGGSFAGGSGTEPYSDGDEVIGGTFSYSDGDEVIGGGFDISYHVLDQSSDYTKIATKDYQIDAVQVTDKVSNLTETYPASTSGCTNIIKIENNPFIPLYATTRLARLYNSFTGFRIRPFSGNYMSDMSREAGDRCVIFDHRGRQYGSIILSYSWSYGNMEEISAKVDEAERILNIN